MDVYYTHLFTQILVYHLYWRHDEGGVIFALDLWLHNCENNKISQKK